MNNNYSKNLNLANKPSQKDLLDTLMNSEKVSGDFTNPELLKEARKRKKRKGQKL